MKRFLRIFMVTTLILTLVAMSLFLIANADHDCDTHACMICHRMEASFSILLGALVLAPVISVNAILMRTTAEGYDAVSNGRPPIATPIILKVKLNN